MKPLREASRQDLEWSQRELFTRVYDLREGEDLLATLRFPSITSAVAVGESTEGQWTLQRVGILHPQVIVRTMGSETPVATLRQPVLGWGLRGQLVLPDQRRFRWAPSDVLGLKFVLANDLEMPLLTLKRPFFKYSPARQHRKIAFLEIHEAARALPELSLLTLLCWYMWL